jgi:hypothetical protein
MENKGWEDALGLFHGNFMYWLGTGLLSIP